MNTGMPKTENADALKSHPNLALSNRISPYISYYSRGSILPVSRLHTLHTTAHSYSTQLQRQRQLVHRHGFHLWQEKQDLCIILYPQPVFPGPRRLCPIQPARIGSSTRRWTLDIGAGVGVGIGKQGKRRCGFQAGQCAVYESDADGRWYAGKSVGVGDTNQGRRVKTVECEFYDDDDDGYRDGDGDRDNRPEFVARVPGDA